MRHYEQARFHSFLVTICCKVLHSGARRTLLFLWFSFIAILVSAATHGIAQTTDSNRTLILYEFIYEKSNYALLNIFDISKDYANITYMAGVKYYLNKDGLPVINPDVHSSINKSFVSKIVDEEQEDKVKQVQKIINAQIDGDWGKLTWKALFEYVRQNSGKTLQLSGNRYSLIHIDYNDFNYDEILKIESSIINNQARLNEIPKSAVKRKYERIFAEKNSSNQTQFNYNNMMSPNEKDPSNENKITAGTSSFVTSPRTGQKINSPTNNSDKQNITDKESKSSSFSWIKWVVIGICLLVLIFFLYLFLSWLFDTRVRKMSESFNNVHRQHNQFPQRNVPYENAQFSGADINQLSNRLSTFEQTYTERLANITRKCKKIDEHLRDFSGAIGRYLNDESERRSALEDSVQKIEKSLYEYKNQFDEYNNNMNEIKFSISKIVKSLSIGLFATGQRDDSLPFLPEVHTQLEEYKVLINRLEKKIDTLSGAGSKDLVLPNEKTMVDVERNMATHKDEEPQNTAGIPNRKIDLSDSY
jgi:hypothetical protein